MVLLIGGGVVIRMLSRPSMPEMYPSPNPLGQWKDLPVSSSKASRDDTELARLLIGSWQVSRSRVVEGKPLLIEGTGTYFSDNTSTFAGTLSAEGKKAALSLSGTWKIENAQLKFKATRCSIPGAKLGDYDSTDGILELNDTVLKLKDDEGHIETYRRISR
jgi:hypothetical protein